MPQLQTFVQPYASGTPIEYSGLGTKLSNMFTSLSSYLPFYSSAEPPVEGVYNDTIGNVYEDNQVLSGLHEWSAKDRLATMAMKDPSGQSGDCAWYNLPCKVANKVSSVTASAGEFVSSTLTKTLVIIAVVGILALFIMSYAQTKGTQLAK